MLIILKGVFPAKSLAQLAGAVDYANCITAEGYDPPPPNECPGYNTKPSDGEAPILGFENVKYPFITISSRSILTWNGSICYGSNYRSSILLYLKPFNYVQIKLSILAILETI